MNIITSDPMSKSLQIDMPIASILQCKGQIFSCVGKVNDIIVDRTSVDEIGLNALQGDDYTIMIYYQLVYMVPRVPEANSKVKQDWKAIKRGGPTYKVPGQLINAIDPDISV